MIRTGCCTARDLIYGVYGTIGLIQLLLELFG